MKQRTSFILKGLISLVLSLVMLCGTAVTSLSAVTVDIAETGVTGDLVTSKRYYIGVGSGGTAKYYLEYHSENVGITNEPGWVVIQTSSSNYLNANGFTEDRQDSVGYEALSIAIVLKAEYDSVNHAYNFYGNYPDGDPRHDRLLTWYMFWNVRTQQVWLGKKGAGTFPEELVVDPDPTPSTYNVTVEQKVTSDGTTFTDTTDAATITSNPATITGLNPNEEVTLTQTQTDNQRKTYTFLGWYSDGDYISTLASCNFTVTADKTVEARYTTNPTKGSYKFSYIDRYGATKIKTVSVALNGAELAGYSGNENQEGVPTYLWNTSADAKALFNNDPLLTASLTVTGHDEDVEGETEQDNVSAYKKDIVWNLQDSTKRTVNAANSTVTIEATTTPVTYTFKYVINNETVTEGATKVPYGKVVTFNPLYQNSNYCYIAEDIPSDGFSYWSSDPAGNNILTTNRTFGMLLRGGSAVWDDVNKVLVVTAYAQYDKDVPENKWLPEIEEATLTRTIADNEDLTYADYMTNYFNYDGIAVQDMLKDSQYNGKIKYGILVVKSKSDLTTTKLTKDQMETVLDRMHDRDGQDNTYCSSAALNDARTRIAYRYEYDDAAHISNFNRTLYTLYGNEAKMNGYTFTAMAYITFDGGENYECSEVNTELVVDNTPSSN